MRKTTHPQFSPTRGWSFLSAAIFYIALSAGAQTYVQRPETDLLLFALRVGNDTLDESFPAYPLGSDIILPLHALSNDLGLAIDVDVTRGTADGFFINESRTFHLDVRAGTITIEGRQRTFDRKKVEVHQDDIYVATDLLSKWLPIDFSVDQYALLLTIRPREPLPTQVRRQRQREVEKTLASLGYAAPKYPRIANPYAMFAPPFIDQQFRVFRMPAPDGRMKTGFDYSTVANGDLLGLEANLFVSGSDEDLLSQFRLGLGRRDEEARLLGPLRAREFEFGEVFYPGFDLVSLPASGPGLLVSSFPLQLETQFDRHTFIGDLTIGWEVELFRNGALIGYQMASSDGRYVFRDVPLLFGFNRFELVFYGPQGQRHAEVQVFNVGENLIPPGHFEYRVAANRPDTLTRRSLAEFAYGLTKELTSDFSASTVDLADGTHQYASGGLRGYWSRLLARADVVRDFRGGTAVRAGIDTRIGPLSVSIEHAQLQDFESEVFRPQYGAIRSRTTLRLSGAVDVPSMRPLPILLDVTNDHLAGGGDVTQLSNLISAVTGSTSISHRLDGVLFHGGRALPDDALAGALLVSRFVRDVNIRGEADYGIRPAFGLTTVGMTAEKRLGSDFLVAAQIARTIPAALTHYIASVSRTEGHLSFGVESDFASNGQLAVRALVSAGIYRDPFMLRWHTQARPIAGRGAVAARVFLDTNGNGVRDAGEQAVENAGFFVNRASDPTRTDASGRALLTNLPPYEPADIALSPNTLEDPLWLPEIEGVRIVPRPGNAAVVDFPVLVTGEITGTVYVERSGKTIEAAGVPVQLVAANGTVVQELRSEYDGFYDFARIVPGTYTVVAKSKDGSAARQVKIEATGTTADGVNLVLR